jgi:hypothetical protein
MLGLESLGPRDWWQTGEIVARPLVGQDCVSIPLMFFFFFLFQAGQKQFRTETVGMVAALIVRGARVCDKRFVAPKRRRGEERNEDVGT